MVVLNVVAGVATELFVKLGAIVVAVAADGDVGNEDGEDDDDDVVVDERN